MSVRPRLLFLLLLAAFCGLAVTFGFFFFRDNFSTHYPIKVLSAAAFRSGEIPWWNFAALLGEVGTDLEGGSHPSIEAAIERSLPLLEAQRSAGAWLWVLSGVAMSALSFYNLIPAIAMVPLAFLAVERRSARNLGIAFGLLALAGEPVTIAATALAVLVLAIGRMRVLPILGAIGISIVIAAPQLLAYGEIASEVERAHGYSARTVLNASFDPRRLLEILIGPFVAIDTPHLFPSLMIGLIAVPALFRKSRYTVIAALMLFFALGSFNPALRAAVESSALLRAGRFPEKFALVLCAALVVLASDYVRTSRTPRIWVVVTFVPLFAWAVWTIPIDWYAPYRTSPQSLNRRIVQPVAPGGQAIDRESYRARARRLEPLFGASAGLEYVLNRSGDGMHSLLSRIASERFATTRNIAWVRIAMAPSSIISAALPAAGIRDAVTLIESGAVAVAPSAFTSAAGAHVTRIARTGQTITIDVASSGPALLAVDQSYFRAWSAQMGDRDLPTMPVNLDRLGIAVPHGGTITLGFGRHRGVIVGLWVLSSLLLVVLLFRLRIEELDRRPSEIQRTGDDDRAVV